MWSVTACSSQALNKRRSFSIESNVVYVPVGGKVRAIQKIVAGRGYQLVTVFR